MKILLLPNDYETNSIVHKCSLSQDVDSTQTVDIKSDAICLKINEMNAETIAVHLDNSDDVTSDDRNMSDYEKVLNINPSHLISNSIFISASSFDERMERTDARSGSLIEIMSDGVDASTGSRYFGILFCILKPYNF
jgi:hypothetical protein